MLWQHRVVILLPAREKILQNLHTGHMGMSRMKALARSFVWWPCLDSQIESVVRCQDVHCAPPATSPRPWTWSTRPWSRIHANYAGSIDSKMVFVVVDAHSKWIEAVPKISATSWATISILRQFFGSHSVPDTLVTENSPCFASKEFETSMMANDIKHMRTAPYHPASNGLSRRAVQTIKNGVRKLTS